MPTIVMPMATSPWAAWGPRMPSRSSPWTANENAVVRWRTMTGMIRLSMTASWRGRNTPLPVRMGSLSTVGHLFQRVIRSRWKGTLFSPYRAVSLTDWRCRADGTIKRGRGRGRGTGRSRGTKENTTAASNAASSEAAAQAKGQGPNSGGPKRKPRTTKKSEDKSGAASEGKPRGGNANANGAGKGGSSSNRGGKGSSTSNATKTTSNPAGLAPATPQLAPAPAKAEHASKPTVQPF